MSFQRPRDHGPFPLLGKTDIFPLQVGDIDILRADRGLGLASLVKIKTDSPQKPHQGPHGRLVSDYLKLADVVWTSWLPQPWVEMQGSLSCLCSLRFCLFSSGQGPLR